MTIFEDATIQMANIKNSMSFDKDSTTYQTVKMTQGYIKEIDDTNLDVDIKIQTEQGEMVIDNNTDLMAIENIVPKK
jgi:hypothetical protein